MAKIRMKEDWRRWHDARDGSRLTAVRSGLLETGVHAGACGPMHGWAQVGACKPTQHASVPRLNAPMWSTVDHRVLGDPWRLHGPITRSTCGPREFLHDPMVQIVVARDQMAEHDSKFD